MILCQNSVRMRAARHIKLLNYALFLAVLGFILLIFGSLMYASEDKQTYGTSFVSVGSTAIFASVILAIYSLMRRRLRPAHIIDDPRIAYIYSHQIITYNNSAGVLHIPTHSRDSSSSSNVLSASNLQIATNSQDIKVVL